MQLLSFEYVLVSVFIIRSSTLTRALNEELDTFSDVRQMSREMVREGSSGISKGSRYPYTSYYMIPVMKMIKDNDDENDRLVRYFT